MTVKFNLSSWEREPVLDNVIIDFIGNSVLNEDDSVFVSGNPGFYLRDINNGKRYTCFVKNCNNVKEGDKVKLVIRKIKPESRIIYATPRIERGDEFYCQIIDRARKNNNFYSRFNDYDVFVMSKTESNLDVRINRVYRVRERYSSLDHRFVWAGALHEITQEEYKGNEFAIFRRGE